MNTTTARSLPLIAAALALGLICEQADAGSAPRPEVTIRIDGQVVHVTDGDTLVLLDGAHRTHTVRLASIDAPETGHGAARPGQPYSAAATGHLRRLARGRHAEATCHQLDIRRREDGTQRVRDICSVVVDGVDLSLAMVDAGLAMAYRQRPSYLRHPTVLAHEQAARTARRGLWQQDAPTPPWRWRRDCWAHQRCVGADEQRP